MGLASPGHCARKALTRAAAENDSAKWKGGGCFFSRKEKERCESREGARLVK